MKPDHDWDTTVAGLRHTLESMHQAREAALRHCRQLVQTSAKCIRHVHRRQFAEADALLQEAKALAAAARAALEPYPDLLYAGFLQDAEKEMVEAAAVISIVAGQPPPAPGDLGVGPAPYLNGLGEAASECRRFLLDELRTGDAAEAERLLGRMETVYDDLVSFDYPDALTGGLRRTCDALRAVVERTRGDVTMTVVQRELMAELKKAQDPTVVL